jgi:hypothetical protein
MMRGTFRWTIFVLYLGVVLAGLTYFIVVGLLRL